MKKLVLSAAIAASVLAGSGCTILDPLLIALGLPLEVAVDFNGGSSWDMTETYDIAAEIEAISTDYLDDVKASRVNDITIHMENPPATGTSSGELRYALGGGPLVLLASWTNVPFTALAEPGVSVLDPTVITVNSAGLTALLAALQDDSGLPPITSVTVKTAGSTSAAVPAGTLVARIHYQIDVEI